MKRSRNTRLRLLYVMFRDRFDWSCHLLGHFNTQFILSLPRQNKTRTDFIILLFFFYSLLIFSSPKWQRASQDPRIDHLRWWHSMLGCTTDGKMGEVRASQACRSFRQHSWHLANPVCWQILGEQHHVIRLRSTFCAVRL